MKTISKTKVFILIVSMFVCFCITSGFTYKPNTDKETAHQIAEMAREMGLDEEDPIIVRAKELWQEADKQFIKDRDILATLIYHEAGYECCDRHMELVAAVVCNRLNHEKYPNTITEIVVAPKQYRAGYAYSDSYLGKTARESDIWEKCQSIATRALNGEIESPENLIFQANYPQGNEVYETFKTSYSTTYFCLG